MNMKLSPREIWIKCLVSVFLILRVLSDSYCASSNTRQSSPTSIPDEYKCNPHDYNQPSTPKTIFGEIRYCQVYYIFDLSEDYLNDDQFSSLQQFLIESIGACFDINVGETISFMNLNVTDDTGDDIHPIDTCCDRKYCSEHILNASRSSIVQGFYPDSNNLIDNNTVFVTNYSITLGKKLKDLSYDNNSCSMNSVVLITNRIVDLSNEATEFHSIFNFSCARFNVILVGRDDATLDDMNATFGVFTKFIYLVKDYNCLMKLVGCLAPCYSGQNGFDNCPHEYLGTCPHPTLPTTPTTTSPPSTTDLYGNDMHVLYTFALSKNTTMEEFNIILKSIEEPVRDYSSNLNLTFALVFDNTVPETQLDTWLNDTDDEHTVKRLNATMRNKPLTKPPIPMIVLITDFLSIEFIKTYDTVESTFASSLSHYQFHIVCTVKEVFDYYQNATNLSQHVNFLNYSDPKMIPIDGSTHVTPTTPNSHDGKISETTVLIIIFGAIGGSLALLCMGSFIYRQRMSWRTKLENIRVNHHKKDEITVDINIDYWELTWDKLLVKSDKLGSGAFGQVLRGKIIGQPPCVEHYYKNLQLRDVSQMENADVAIKMLPKYADDAAKKEFMNEIELMKTIGYHDNIVNMLGCVTIGHPICLVLEFCPYRDLHQYVKARKVEVSISKSIEEKINHTKDFLIFGWQIAHGMKFLASKGIIHRDLAARNILIDGDKNAKIGDFGLCIQINENTSAVRKSSTAINASGRLPIKWLAIESLKRHEFSFKSDIWSFGIVLFEMYSFGEIPFSKVEPKDLMEHLEAGHRPAKPELCNQETYDIMTKCWLASPEERPSFEELLTVFTVFLERSTEGYGYLPLLKSETTQVTHDVSQKLAEGINPTVDTAEEQKKNRKRLHSTPSLSLFRAISRRWSATSKNKNEKSQDSEPNVSKESYCFENYYNDPDLEQGLRSRFQSSLSVSAASNHEIMDPGVEMVNGRLRLKQQVPNSNTSSMRKSLSFHHGQRNQLRNEQQRKSVGFKDLIMKKFLKESNPDLPKI